MEHTCAHEPRWWWHEKKKRYGNGLVIYCNTISHVFLTWWLKREALRYNLIIVIPDMVIYPLIMMTFPALFTVNYVNNAHYSDKICCPIGYPFNKILLYWLANVFLMFVTQDNC